MRTVVCVSLLALFSGCLFITVDPAPPSDEPGDGGAGDAEVRADGCGLPDRECGDWIDVDTEPCQDCAAPPVGCHYEGGIPCMSCGTLVCDDDDGECTPPTQPSSCDQVSSFQCGFMAECRDGVLHATWHEHWWCPGDEPGVDPENLANFGCSFACPGGCEEGMIYDWPQVGSELIDDHCLPVDEVDAGNGDSGSCVIDCASPPPGCHYAGNVTCESCGDLVCDDAGYACTCPEPQPGCRAEGRNLDFCLCGEIVCDDGGVEPQD